LDEVYVIDGGRDAVERSRASLDASGTECPCAGSDQDRSGVGWKCESKFKSHTWIDRHTGLEVNAGAGDIENLSGIGLHGAAGQKDLEWQRHPVASSLATFSHTAPMAVGARFLPSLLTGSHVLEIKHLQDENQYSFAQICVNFSPSGKYVPSETESEIADPL
jgi:hypothetical protein